MIYAGGPGQRLITAVPPHRDLPAPRSFKLCGGSVASYYCFFPDNYVLATIHLGWLEDLAYRRLLDLYYSRGKPLPNDLAYLHKACRANEPEQKAAVEMILGDFFHLRSDGWHNARADAELSRIASWSNRGKRGAEARWSENKELVYAQALHKHRTSNAPTPTPTPTPTKPPEPTAQSPHPPAADPIPYQRIVDLYHQKLSMLPRVFDLSPARKAQIRARWKEGSLPDLEAWAYYFDQVAKSKFLTGMVDPKGGRKPFLADLEWLTRQANFLKVAEDKYA